MKTIEHAQGAEQGCRAEGYACDGYAGYDVDAGHAFAREEVAQGHEPWQALAVKHGLGWCRRVVVCVCLR